MLHQFKDAAALILNFKRLLNVGGHLYMTSLVRTNRFIGDHYLKALHAAGEFVRPRTESELKEILNGSLGQKVSCWTTGNMAFVAATIDADLEGCRIPENDQHKRPPR